MLAGAVAENPRMGGQVWFGEDDARDAGRGRPNGVGLADGSAVNYKHVNATLGNKIPLVSLKPSRNPGAWIREHLGFLDADRPRGGRERKSESVRTREVGTD